MKLGCFLCFFKYAVEVALGLDRSWNVAQSHSEKTKGSEGDG